MGDGKDQSAWLGGAVEALPGAWRAWSNRGGGGCAAGECADCCCSGI